MKDSLLDLTQIRYFLALARALNFTRAAEACHVTQPALTKSIQRLEEELGGPLLLRERSHTQLTPLGDAMLPLLRQTYEAAEAARTGAASFRAQGVARLCIGLGAWVEPAIVAPLIREVTRRIPDIELAMRHGEIGTLNEWLLSSKVDLVLTAEADRLTERANRWPVFSDPIVVLIAADDPLAGRGCVTVEQLRGYALVGRMNSGNDDGDAGPELEAMVRGLPIRHRATSEAQVHALVLAGVGLALSTGRHKLPAGVVSRRIEPQDHLDVVVASIAGRPVSRAADAFLRLARARDWKD